MVPNEYTLSRKTTKSMGAVIVVFGIFIGFSLVYLFMISSSDEYYDVDLPVSSETLDWARLHVGYDDRQKEEKGLDNRIVANILFNEVKILCWVMTKRENHNTSAIHVLNTWGSRCNKILFMSNELDEKINAIKLPVNKDVYTSLNKTKEAAKYIYSKHLDEYDWFLKAEDDTFVIIENLRFLLYPYAADEPIYFGCKYKTIVKQGFMSSGAGYVLSKEALRRFVEEAIPDKDKCREDDNGYEETEMGKCLENVHVIAGDSRDSFGRGRFSPFLPENLVIPDQLIPDAFNIAEHWEFLNFKREDGINGWSDNAVSFHHVSGTQMHVLDYLIYQARPHGIVRYPQSLPRKH